MGTKKSQSSQNTEASATSTPPTASQTTPVTPTFNRTRGRNTAAQSTTKTADKATGPTKSQTENQQSQFAVPDTVRRSGRKTTLPKNLIHDSVIETPTNRNRRESVASESSRRRNSSASSNKSSRRKQPAEKKKESTEQPRSNIKLEGQILTSSDEEFPRTHKKGSLYGWRRLPPMTPPTPGRKTWESDSDQEERRGTRGNLGWGPLKEKEKMASEVGDSQEEGDTGTVSPRGQDEAIEEARATGATAQGPLVIESDDTDRDYDAELSELESSPASSKPGTTSEVPDRQGKDDIEDVGEQRPLKRRKLVITGEDDQRVEEKSQTTEFADSGSSTSKPKKIWVPEDDDMDFLGQYSPSNGVKADAHVAEENTQAKAAPEVGELTIEGGSPNQGVVAQEEETPKSQGVPNSPAPAMGDESIVQGADRMEVDAGESQEPFGAREQEVDQPELKAAEQLSLDTQIVNENPSVSQDTIMVDNEHPPDVHDATKIDHETAYETGVKSPTPASQQGAVNKLPEALESMYEDLGVMEEDALPTEEGVNPSSMGGQHEPAQVSSSQSETKNLQPAIEDVTDEEDLPHTGSGFDVELVRGVVLEEEFMIEEKLEDQGGRAVTPDEITTPDEAVMPDEIETAPVTAEPSEAGGEHLVAVREEEDQYELLDGEYTDMDHRKSLNDVVEVEGIEGSEITEGIGIIGIEELEDNQLLEEATEDDHAEVPEAMQFELATAISESEQRGDDELPDATNDVLQHLETEMAESRDTICKESGREPTPALVSTPEHLPVTVGEVEYQANIVAPVATEEPEVPEVSPQDMRMDEDQQDHQEQDLVGEQGQGDTSPSSVDDDHMEDTGVEKLRELSLGAVESEMERGQEIVEKTIEVNGESYSKSLEASNFTDTIHTEAEGEVSEIEITVSRTEVEVVEEYLVGSKPEETVKDTSHLETEPVETQKKGYVTPGLVETPVEPAEAPRSVESDEDDTMEDIKEVEEVVPTIEDENHEMQEATEAGEEVGEKASGAAEEAQVGNAEASEDQTTTESESQGAEDSTTVMAQQEQDFRSMEQQTEERQKESIAEEPDTSQSPVDDLGAENDSIDDDDHIILYSSSSGLPSDDELGPDGVIRAGAKRRKRRRRARRSKAEKAAIKGVIDDKTEQPQLDGPAFNEPSWNGGDDNIPPAQGEEPQSDSQVDEPETKAGETIKDLDMDGRDWLLHESRPESPEGRGEDDEDISEPEINEDVGLPPDFEIPESEGSVEDSDDRESAIDADLSNGAGLINLLRAAEVVENTKPPGPLQTRKEVLPSRTFRMFGDAWERIGKDVIPKLPHVPEIPQPFPDNIVNLGDWEGIGCTKCPICSEPLGDVISAMDNAQTTQNTIAEHIENCGKQKASSESLKSKARDLRHKTSALNSAPTLPVKTGEGVRRINLRVKLSDGTYFQNPSQASSAPAPVDTTSTKPVPRPPPTLSGIVAQLPKNAAEYARALRDIEEHELLPNIRDIFKPLTGEREMHSDSENSLPDAYEYDFDEYGDNESHPLPDEAYFMKNTPISVFQTRAQESFKRSYAHAFAEQENVVAAMTQLQAEYLELEEEIAARERRMPKRLRPLDSRVVFEDKKEADLYNYKYDPDPKKRGRQDPDAQRTDSVYVGGRELRGRARNREGAAEFLQGRKRRAPAPASQIPRPIGTRGPGRPRKEVHTGTDSGMTSVQPSRDASLDATVTPQASPAKRGNKVVRNPRGYNGRNKPVAEVVSVPQTREPSPTPVAQAAPAVPPKRRGRKSNAQKAMEAEAAAVAKAAAAAAAAIDKAKRVKESEPKEAGPEIPMVQERRRVSGRGRPPKVQPVATEVSDATASQPASSIPSGSAPERQFVKPVTIKPAAPKPDSTKPAIPKPPVAKTVGKRREILKLKMSSDGSQKVEQILSPTTAPGKSGEEKVTESDKNSQTEESNQESSLGEFKEEIPASTLLESGPTAPESFYGSTPTAVPSDATVSGPSNPTSANTAAPFTILTPTLSSTSSQWQFVPSRMVSTPAPASPVTAASPPASGPAPRQFFGNASRRARRGEFINSGVNNDSTPYKTYASGKVVGNAPVQVQMQDRAVSPEEPRTSVPPQPSNNVQLDFVMDITVPQLPAPAPSPVPAPPISVLSPALLSQAINQPATAPAVAPPVPIAILQPAQQIGATQKTRRGVKASTGAKGAGQSTFLPTITPDNWRLKKGVKQTVKTESGSGPSPREGSVFRDMSGRVTPATSVGSTPITPSAPSFQLAEMAGQNHGRDMEWMGPPVRTPPPSASMMQIPAMPMSLMSMHTTATPSVSVSTPGMTAGYVHNLHSPNHNTLTPYIKPPVDSPVQPYGSQPPIQQLSFVNANPGGAKPKGTRGKTYKKPTMGMDFPKPTKEDEFKALTGGQMDLGKRKRKLKGEGLGGVMEGTLAPVPGGYPGQGVIGGGMRTGAIPGSPKRIRFDDHMGLGSSQSSNGYLQSFDREVEMYQAPPQSQSYYSPPAPHLENQLPMQMHYYPPGSQEILSQAPGVPMASQTHSRPTTSSASEQTESQEQMAGGETPHSLRSDSEEKVPGEGSFQINMWRPPIPRSIA